MSLRRRNLLRMGGVLAGLALFPARGLAQVSTTGNPRLMQGPMLGAATPDSLAVWARASGSYLVQVEYSEREDFAGARLTPPLLAAEEDDFCVVCLIERLRPATAYYYRVLVEGREPKYLQRLVPFRARTAPAGAAPFRLAFGSCARVEEDPEQPVWDSIARARPDLFFWLGDNIYADATLPGMLAEQYRRQRDVPSARQVLRTVPQLAIWDDHDFGTGSADGSFAIKRQSLQIFRQYWANPAYGMPGTPGVFFRYAYGGADFFFLDGRYHRTPNSTPDGPAKTLLGAAQRAWLEGELLASRAPFKFLVSGTGWSMAEPDGADGDNWAPGFRHERDGLFEFIRRNNISGVVLLSGDTHAGELNAIPWSERGGYDFYDLVASPLAQDTSTGFLDRRPERRIRETFSGGVNFGLIEIDCTQARPCLRYSLRNLYGEGVWPELVLYADELVNGTSTWRKKMSAGARQWHEDYGPALKP